jgi:hypothetical protein
MRAWFLGVMLLGCGTKDDKSAPAPQPEVKVTAADAGATGGECAKHAERIERELRELATTKPGFLPLVQGINAPSPAGGKPINERGWVIAVTRDGSMFIQGSRFANLEDVRSATDTWFKSALEKFVMGGGSGRDLRVPLYIWADREAPARVVAELVAAADPEGPWPKRAGQAKSDDPPPPKDDPPPPDDDRNAARKQAAGILGKSSDPRPSRVPMRLLVGADGAPPSPEPADAKLPASEPEATVYVAQQLRAAIGACGPIIKTLGTASLEGLPAKEAEKLAKEIPVGLRACDCKVDVSAFEAGMRTWFGAWAPPLAWIEMPKLDKKDKRTLGQALKP